ncbi:MAG: DHH family phosphoesterase [Alistipes sp.]|jgi:phosphoesterase RecJ-like protein|nr:DHH family phosphoesterase [Alistipes sp.]
MTISSYKIARLREMLATPRNVLIVSHYNPDGDALGASIAWAKTLEGLGHRTMCVVPNKYPHFLEWMPGAERIRVYTKHAAEVNAAASAADIICCLDFNNPSRLEGLTAAIEANTHAERLLIDHHLAPPEEYFNLSFSYPGASSTSYIVYKLISRLAGAHTIDRDMGTALYVGMMTDTGNFSFSFLTPDLFRVVAALVEKGVDIPYINFKVYNSYTQGRVRLLAYSLGPKMDVFEGGQAACISLTESELRRFHFKQGDSEGFVNYPLSIETVKMSALMLENHKFIRVSLRSRGDVDVNAFARRYFDGGGHRNAAGGKSTDTMEATIARYKRAVREFFREGGITG